MAWVGGPFSSRNTIHVFSHVTRNRQKDCFSQHKVSSAERLGVKSNFFGQVTDLNIRHYISYPDLVFIFLRPSVKVPRWCLELASITSHSSHLSFRISVLSGTSSHCATKRKVAGLISDGVTKIFHWLDPSDRTMALGSTQTLTEMSNRDLPWG